MLSALIYKYVIIFPVTSVPNVKKEPDVRQKSPSGSSGVFADSLIYAFFAIHGHTIRYKAAPCDSTILRQAASECPTLYSIIFSTPLTPIIIYVICFSLSGFIMPMHLFARNPPISMPMPPAMSAGACSTTIIPL